MTLPNTAIRELVPADLPHLRELYLATRLATFTWVDPRSFSLWDYDSDTANENVLVAERAGHVAGFISWWPPENFVHNLFVHPGDWRNGIGHRLLSACLAQCGRPAKLKCLQKNVGALEFYLSQGWTIRGEGTGEAGPHHIVQLD